MIDQVAEKMARKGIFGLLLGGLLVLSDAALYVSPRLWTERLLLRLQSGPSTTGCARACGTT